MTTIDKGRRSRRPHKAARLGTRACLTLLGAALFSLAIAATPYAQTDNESCFDCHDDAELVADDGSAVGVLFRATFSTALKCLL